jgi:bacterioferritin (cytochrome b1)
LSYANGGPRLRKATKRETVGGIVFQDYENYEILDKTISTTEYDKAFLEGKSKLLSKIEQSNYSAN